MKLLALQIAMMFAVAGVLCANDPTPTSLTRTEIAEVRQQLEVYEKGEVTYKELTHTPEQGKKVIAYYLSNTNAVTVKMKLPISRNFIGLGKLPEAARLAQEYVNVYSNDWRGWSILGGAKIGMKSYDEALVALTNAAKLGDKDNYASLGVVALAVGRYDIVRTMVVPRLLVLKDAKPSDEVDKYQVIAVLVSYALKTDEQKIYVKALEGVSAKDILARDDLKQLVTADSTPNE